jgi:DNA-directed RNA polymerase specialized sigma24 family protein
MSEITQILAQAEQGDAAAAEQLLPLVYDELRKLAAARLAHERPGQTLQATALVHEAYLRLIGPDRRAGPELSDGARNSEVGGPRSEINPPIAGVQIPSSNQSRSAIGTYTGRGHFFAAAAEAMRRILIERARRRRQVSRGGDRQRVPLEEVAVADEPPHDLLALDEALSRLENHDPVAASLVKLRFFAGLTMPEAAAALDIPLRTAERNWTYARTWLLRELS